MNKRISLSVGIVFLAVFTLLFIFNDAFSDISTEQFYDQEFNPIKKKIFIYGSSHAIQLNSSHINHQVSLEKENYIVYNMAENADTPKRRSINLQKDINLNPEIIFYQISFRDFALPKTNEIKTNELKLIDIIPIDFTELETMNPKLTTMQVARSALIDILSIKSNTDIPYPNNPAFSDRGVEEIISDEELRKNPISKLRDIRIPNDEQIQYFKTILKTYDEENIKVVIFISPLSDYAIESIPIQEKNKFFELLSNIKNEFNVKIYDLSEEYANLKIWRDPTHVAYNPNALVFSDDIAKIIINEIEQ